MAKPVLIADDSGVARHSVASRLRASGIALVERESAAGASAVDPLSLSCALLDLELGDGLGTDVAERLRHVVRSLPIAFFTSSREPNRVNLARTYGPVFEKPGELHRAIEWVRRCVNA